MCVWFWRCFKVNIPPSIPYLFIFFYVIGIALSVIALNGTVENSYASWAVGVGNFLLYLLFTDAQKAGEDMIKVGDAIPTYKGTDENGKIFDTSTLSGKRVLIKFFRGFW